MNYINIHISTLRTREYAASDPVQRATWLNLMAYCVEQENGGKISDCAGWNCRLWQFTCGVTKREVGSNSALWSFDDEGTLTVWGYPVDQEDAVRAKRLGGAKGGKKPETPENTGEGAHEWPSNDQADGSPQPNHEGEAAGTPEGYPHGQPHGQPHGYPQGEPHGGAKEKKGKERKGKEEREQASIHLEWQWNDGAAATSTNPALSPASPEAQDHGHPKPEFGDVCTDPAPDANHSRPASPPVVNVEPLGLELAGQHAKAAMDALKARINGLRQEWAKPSVWNHSEDRLLFEGTAGQFAELDDDDWSLLKRYLNAPLNGDKGHWVPRNRSMFVKTFPDVLSSAHAWGRANGHRHSTSTSGIKIPDFMRK